MGIRKNAKFLSPTEKEDFVRACVLMKADIVNPGAAANQQYSRWDEQVALHLMIQLAFAPGAASVNFGHGGLGRYSFLSWHRYFLYRMELALQGYVPGVMIPYWDWSDPASIMTDDFLGPDGSVGSEVRSGYFAADAPGTVGGTNPTPAPPWWPASLTGWRLPAFAGFGTFGGPLRRNLSGVASLPTALDLREALGMGSYSPFQNALESGSGITNFPAQQLHNGMHGWIGGHMGNPTASPFDPIFYLQHCNIDRLWAMWQADGHASEYPLAGGAAHHNRNDLMYPWHGGAAGYGTNATISSSIPMPDFAALGAQTNGSTLDYRAAFGYAYDTISIIGLGLDRTGSMNGLTPDPMVVAAPDVTKWEAAKRGVSAFLQDCETVYNNGVSYVVAGVKTFRTLAANDFANVLPAPGYGVIKAGGTHSRAAFDGAVAAMTPGGNTPLADALLDVKNTLVDAPFGDLPAGERRYLAMLTDGMLTSGAPMNSIADGSFDDVAVFGMGFGTGADVDYATIASMVAKGVTLTTAQVFHGENAGAIDKFYSDSLAAAIGFTTVIDPVLELFAGEHAHIDFHATSAEDAFFITVQGMDFNDGNWAYMLHGPDGSMVYGDAHHQHPAGGCGHHCCPPNVTANRANGRLSLVINRDNTDDACWVGTWRLMACYRTRGIGAMMMPVLGELLVPVQASPPRGPRYSRLLLDPKSRVALRNVHSRAAHALDDRVVSTNRDSEPACAAVVNIYARTQLRLTLVPKATVSELGAEIGFTVHNDLTRGSVTLGRSLTRLIAPTRDLAKVVAEVKPNDIPRDALLDGESKFDAAKLLAYLERKDRKLALVSDRQIFAAQHGDGPLHFHIDKTEIAGGYHIGMYIEGLYCPDHGAAAHAGHHLAPSPPNQPGLPPGCGPGCKPQRFTRILTSSVAVPSDAIRPDTRPTAKRKAAKKTAKKRR